ncbi:MAG: OB-fold domain-containing protein [Collinsella stercoris]|uniref:OB-fold domain-containing protein n=1 Tax=Collinsella stercoris TaxID=147206 RepID=UPI003995AB5C
MISILKGSSRRPRIGRHRCERIGFELGISATTASSLAGRLAHCLYTRMVVREDSCTLFNAARRANDVRQVGLG